MYEYFLDAKVRSGRFGAFWQAMGQSVRFMRAVAADENRGEVYRYLGSESTPERVEETIRFYQGAFGEALELLSRGERVHFDAPNLREMIGYLKAFPGWQVGDEIAVKIGAHSREALEALLASVGPLN